MIRRDLFTVLGYIWAAFGAYWIVFARITGPHTGESRSRRLSLTAILLVTFGFLFLIHNWVSPITLIILAVAWAALGLYWSAGTEVAGSGESGGYRFLRLGILAVTFALLFWDRAAVGLLGTRFLPPGTPFLAIAGLVCALVGMATAVWARVHLGIYWSDKVRLQTDHQLIRSGPYVYMRHPIYSGVLLGVFGTALVQGEWRGLLAFVLLLTNYVIKAKREERILAARFGDEFSQHRSQAGFLVPKLRA